MSPRFTVVSTIPIPGMSQPDVETVDVDSAQLRRSFPELADLSDAVLSLLGVIYAKDTNGVQYEIRQVLP